jgi:hypothetical protein
MRSWLDFHYGLCRSGKITTTFEGGIETYRFIKRKGILIPLSWQWHV